MIGPTLLKHTLSEHCEQLSCVDSLRSAVQDSVGCVKSFERQIVVHSAELSSARGDMTGIEMSATVAQRQSADSQSALFTVDWKHNEYCRRHDVEEQSRGSFKALLCGLCIRLVDHASLVDSVRGFPRQNMDRDLDDYLRAFFDRVSDRPASFCSATSSVVETHSETLLQDGSSIFTHLDGRLAA